MRDVMPSLVMTAVQEMTLQVEAEPTLLDQDFVRVEVHSCGICGSDMHAYHGHDERRVPPIVLGHEVVGWLVEEGIRKPVAINPLICCGLCHYCQSGREHLCPEREMIGMRLPGGFSPSVMVKRDNVCLLPVGLDFSMAVLAEPLACCIHAVRLALQCCFSSVEHANVTILGGGAIGLLIAQILRIEGAKNIQIIEANSGRRLVLAETLPEMSIVAPENSADQQQIVFDAVGSGITRQVSSAIVNPGGVILHIGLQNDLSGLDTRRLTLQEVTFLGCYCYDRNDFDCAISLLAQGLITGGRWLDYRPIAQGAEAFQELHQGTDILKIVLTL